MDITIIKALIDRLPLNGNITQIENTAFTVGVGLSEIGAMTLLESLIKKAKRNLEDDLIPESQIEKLEIDEAIMLEAGVFNYVMLIDVSESTRPGIGGFPPSKVRLYLVRDTKRNFYITDRVLYFGQKSFGEIGLRPDQDGKLKHILMDRLYSPENYGYRDMMAGFQSTLKALCHILEFHQLTEEAHFNMKDNLLAMLSGIMVVETGKPIQPKDKYKDCF